MAKPQDERSRPSKKKESRPLQEALRLRGLGYSVIPIKPSQKIPFIKWKEFQSRIATEEEIHLWYKNWPDAGIGLVTESILVVDDDDKDGGYGFSKRLETESPKHPRAHTPRGGQHHIFRAPQDLEIPSSAGILADKVDVRAKGGYIVVYPSVIDGVGEYQWEEGRRLDVSLDNLPLPPGGLIEELGVKANKPKESLKEHLAAAAPVDAIRNVNYTREAGYLRRIGATSHTLLGYLRARNEESNDPLDDDELCSIAKSIATYPPDQAAYESMGGAWSSPRLRLPSGSLANQAPAVSIELLMDLEKRAKVEDLIPGLIPKSVLCFVVAKPESGKSLFLEGAAYSVATGMPLLGNGPKPKKTGWVLLLLSEGANSWGARSRAFRKHYEIEPTDQIAAVTFGVDFTETSRITALVDAINGEIEKRGGELPTLVILDTLSSSIPGLDENQQSAMTPVCGVMQSWATEGVTIIVAHHLTKDGKRIRGSTVIEASAERSLHVKNSHGRCLVTPEKVRDGVVQPFPFDIISVDDYPVPVHCPSDSLDFILIDAEDELLDVLNECGFNRDGSSATGAFSKGVTTKDIISTWQAKHPVSPTRKENQSEYDHARNRRKSRTADILKKLQESGYLASGIQDISTATKAQIHKATFMQKLDWQEE